MKVKKYERGQLIMGFIDVIKEKARADKKTIVLPESEDRRVLEATAAILREGLANVVLIGDEEQIKKGRLRPGHLRRSDCGSCNQR